MSIVLNESLDFRTSGGARSRRPGMKPRNQNLWKMKNVAPDSTANADIHAVHHLPVRVIGAVVVLEAACSAGPANGMLAVVEFDAAGVRRISRSTSFAVEAKHDAGLPRRLVSLLRLH
jgi:hypothetical protein